MENKAVRRKPLLEILPLNTKVHSDLSSFLTLSLSNPYAPYGVSQDLFVNCVISEISDTVSKGGFILVAREGGKIVGLVSLNRSDWDSKHFAFDMSKIDQLLAVGNYLDSTFIKQRLVSNLIARCSKELLLHVSARVNKEDLSSIHALERKYFRLMDILVTYSIDLRKHIPIQTENPYHIRKFRPDEVSKLEQIALECFRDRALSTDRFHADPTFPRSKSSELYAKWLVNSCNDPANEVLVAEIDGKPVGFNVCAFNPSLTALTGIRIGTMTLTAVDSLARNKLVATSLLSASLSWFADKVDVIETGGQVSNIAIQRAWNSVGLRITRSQCTFHWSVLTESL
jgi:RimJ/RimL family protein N-acetyltransferase